LQPPKAVAEAKAKVAEAKAKIATIKKGPEKVVSADDGEVPT